MKHHTQHPEKKFVLIVEDDLVYQQLLKGFLNNLGYETLIANGGAEARDFIAKFKPSDLLHIEAIITDVVMEEGEGLSLLEDIRSHKILGDVPVILISSAEDDLIHHEAKRFRASAFLKKPVTLEKLREVLNS